MRKLKVYELGVGEELDLPRTSRVLSSSYNSSRNTYVVLVLEEVAEEKGVVSGEVAVVLDETFRKWGRDLMILLEEFRQGVAVFEVAQAGEDFSEIADGVYSIVGRSDVEIIEKLRKLSENYRRVYFVTGDKKLADAVRGVVSVIYSPPTFTSKHSALRYIADRIIEELRSL